MYIRVCFSITYNYINLKIKEKLNGILSES